MLCRTMPDGACDQEVASVSERLNFSEPVSPRPALVIAYHDTISI